MTWNGDFVNNTKVNLKKAIYPFNCAYILFNLILFYPMDCLILFFADICIHALRSIKKMMYIYIHHLTSNAA